MSARFVDVDRETPMLLPPDLRDWVPEDDMVHFVIEAVHRLPLESLRVNHRGTGDRQFPPHMMLALLIYSYANGIFSSRKIEDATHHHVAFRYLTGNTHPDHDTICKFRRENFEAFNQAFVSVLELAKELQLLKLGTVALDGTHIKANASIDKNITYERAMEVRRQLEQDVAELLEQAEKADQGDESEHKLPKEIARREKLIRKMDQAIDNLKQRAESRDEKAQAKYEAKLRERQLKEEQTGKKPGGRPPQPPKTGPENSKEQSNLTDADARLMRKNKRSGFTQSYNAQVAVDADGSQLIVGQHVSQSASDSAELENGINSIPEKVGRPDSGLADAGYVDAEAIERIEKDQGIEMYVSVHREDAHSERTYDYRPKEQTERPKKKVKDPRLIAMREKLQTDAGKELYAKRNHTVETAFGIIKAVMGFRGFLLRGIDKVSGEWSLVSLSYNVRRLHRMIQSA